MRCLQQLTNRYSSLDVDIAVRIHAFRSCSSKAIFDVRYPALHPWAILSLSPTLLISAALSTEHENKDFGVLNAGKIGL